MCQYSLAMHVAQATSLAMLNSRSTVSALKASAYDSEPCSIHLSENGARMEKK